MYVCVYIYIYIYVYIYIYIYECVYIYIYIHTYIHMNNTNNSILLIILIIILMITITIILLLLLIIIIIVYLNIAYITRRCVCTQGRTTYRFRAPFFLRSGHFCKRPCPSPLLHPTLPSAEQAQTPAQSCLKLRFEFVLYRLPQ